MRQVDLSSFGIDVTGLERNIRDKYPTIIALSYERFRSQEHPSLAFQALLLTVFQNVLRHLSLMALSEYLHQEEISERLNESLAVLSKPQYGHWAGLLREADAHFRTSPPFLIPELAGLLTPKMHRRLKIKALVSDLLGLKNKKVSHGSGPLPAEEASHLLSKYEWQVMLWLDDLQWMCDYPLLYRSPNGAFMKMEGVAPVESLPSSSIVVDPHLEGFFLKADRLLPAFPFYLNIWVESEKSAPGLFLFNGAYRDRIVYLSHSAEYDEKDSGIIALARDLLNRKAVQFSEVFGELTAGGIREKASEHTHRVLEGLSSRGKYNPELFVQRTMVQSALDYWISSKGKDASIGGSRPVLILAGEAGSGKSMALLGLAGRLAGREYPVVLIPARELWRADEKYLEEAVRKACGRPEAVEEILNVVTKDDGVFYLLVDAVDEHAAPAALLKSLLAMAATHASAGLRIAVTIRKAALDLIGGGEAGRELERNAGITVHFDNRGLGGGEADPFFLIPRLGKEEVQEFFDRYRAVYSIPTTFGELDPISQGALDSPLLMRLTCEAFGGRRIPPHLSPHRVFFKYLQAILRNPLTGKPDEVTQRFLSRFIGVLLERRLLQAEEDSCLLEDPVLRPWVDSRDWDSPYNRLLDQGVLVRITEEEEGFFPITTTWVRVNFERFLEYLLLAFPLRRAGAQELAEKLGDEPSYGPLSGVLNLRLLLAAEERDLGTFRSVTPHLGHEDVFRAFSRTLEECSYIDLPFLLDVVKALAGSCDLKALESVLGLAKYVSGSGRWDLSEQIRSAVMSTTAAGCAELSEVLDRLDLVYAHDLFARGENYAEALEVFQRLAASEIVEIRLGALEGEILVYDTIDRERYRQASERCLRIGEELKNDHVVAFALWSLGGYFEYSGDYGRAVEYYREIFELDRRVAAGGGVLTMRPYAANLAPAYKWMGRSLAMIPVRVHEAEAFFLRALQLEQESNSLYQINVSWNNLSWYYLQVGRIEQALEYSEKEFSQQSLFPEDPEWACSYFHRGRLMMMMGRWEEAAQDIAQSVAIGEGEGGHQQYLPEAYFASVCIAAKNKDILAAEKSIELLQAHLDQAGSRSEKDLLQFKASRLVLSLLGVPGAQVEVDEGLIAAYRAARLLPDGCTTVGLAFLSADSPEAVRRCPKLLGDLKEASQEIGNSFWGPWIDSWLAKADRGDGVPADGRTVPSGGEPLGASTPRREDEP